MLADNAAKPISYLPVSMASESIPYFDPHLWRAGITTIDPCIQLLREQALNRLGRLQAKA
jgi:hypothetical protein